MENMSADVTPYNLMKSNSSQSNSVPTVVKENFNPNSLYYDMGKNKYFHIFNHYQYDETEEFEVKPEVRDGTEADVIRLHEVFEPLGFIVKLYNDYNYVELMKKIIEVVEGNHTDTSCVCIAILTHGDKDGGLYARDRPYNLKDITKLLEHKNLVAIPKLLFIQACRGDIAEDGYFIEFDSTSKMAHVPSQIDFLIMNSTVEGYCSFRGELTGSWMIQVLCSIIEEYRQYDILTLITFVNHFVGYRLKSFNTEKPEIHNKKQAIETRFTLTKLLKF